MARYAYLDSSAVAKLLVSEPETEELERGLLDFDGLVSSRLTESEAHRASRRRSRRLLQQASDVFESIVLVDVTPAILKRAGALAPPELRTLDAIHLATALALNIGDLDFITYDVSLARAARAHGLIVRP